MRECGKVIEASFLKCVVVVCVDIFLNSFQLSRTQTVLMLITHSAAHTTSWGGEQHFAFNTHSLRCVFFTLHVRCVLVREEVFMYI